MRSEASTVDEYLLGVPEKRVAAISKLRELCQEILIGYEEGMVYGMPTYAKNGVVEIAFASQKNQISFYGLKSDVVNANLDLMKGIDRGKSCIRFSDSKKIDFDLIRKLLLENVKSDGKAC